MYSLLNPHLPPANFVCRVLPCSFITAPNFFLQQWKEISYFMMDWPWAMRYKLLWVNCLRSSQAWIWKLFWVKGRWDSLVTCQYSEGSSSQDELLDANSIEHAVHYQVKQSSDVSSRSRETMLIWRWKHKEERQSDFPSCFILRLWQNKWIEDRLDWYSELLVRWVYLFYQSLDIDKRIFYLDSTCSATTSS